MKRTWLQIMVIVVLVSGRAAYAGTEMAEPAEAPPPAAPGYYDKNPFKVSTDVRQYDVGMHVELFGGANITQSGNVNISSPQLPDLDNTLSTKGQAGGVAGVKIGYTFAGWGGQCADTNANLITAVNGDFRVLPAIDYEMFWTGYEYKGQGTLDGSQTQLTTNLNAYTFSLDPLLKFQVGMFRPYLGAGVGGSYITTNNGTASANGLGFSHSTGDTSDFCFSVQGLAGVEIFLARDWVLTVNYKYLDFVDPTFNSNSNNGVQVRYHSNNLGQQIATAGIGYYF